MSTQQRFSIGILAMIRNSKPVPYSGATFNDFSKIRNIMEQSTKQVAPEVLAQQIAYKQSKETFRAVIKNLVNRQVELRKFLSQPHTPASSRLQAERRVNRYDLRHLYWAYAEVREKHGGASKNRLNRMGSATYGKKLFKRDYVTKLIEQYGPKVIHLDQK